MTAAWPDAIVDWELEAKRTNKSVEAKRATQKRDIRGPTQARPEKIRACNRSDKPAAGIRDLAIFALGERPMLRRSEIAALTVENVDRENETIRVFGKKRTASETLNLVDDTIRHVKPWMDLRKELPSRPLFVRIRARNRPASPGHHPAALTTPKRLVEPLTSASTLRIERPSFHWILRDRRRMQTSASPAAPIKPYVAGSGTGALGNVLIVTASTLALMYQPPCP